MLLFSVEHPCKIKKLKYQRVKIAAKFLRCVATWSIVQSCYSKMLPNVRSRRNKKWFQSLSNACRCSSTHPTEWGERGTSRGRKIRLKIIRNYSRTRVEPLRDRAAFKVPTGHAASEQDGCNMLDYYLGRLTWVCQRKSRHVRVQCLRMART